MKKVLVWGLTNNRAGTEAIITTYVRASNGISFDFLCYDEPKNHSDLFENTNNNYYVLPIKIKHPFAYKKALKRFMEENAYGYSSLWFNVNEISNIDLLVLAEKYHIPQRIIHIHNSKFPNVWITKLFSYINWKRCLSLSTDYWACSEDAGEFLYRNKPFRLIPNLVDAETIKFSERKRRLIREEYQLHDAFVIGSVGRLAEQKNNAFLIGLMPRLLEINPKVVLLLVGDGPLHCDLWKKVVNLGLEEKVIFAGSQEDIQAYLSSFDVFALASFFEGLSVSVLEAQFNGLPCVVSEGVGDKSAISTGISVLSLEEPEVWASRLLAAGRKDTALIEEKARKYSVSRIDEVVSTMFV